MVQFQEEKKLEIDQIGVVEEVDVAEAAERDVEVDLLAAER